MLKRAFLFVVLFGIGLLTYYRGLHIPFYNDDFQRAFTNPREMVFQGFTSANPHDGFYRPLEQTALAAIQILWKWDSLPIRLLHLLFNSALALLVFHSLRKLEVHLVSAVIAALYVIMSQLGAFTILSNNTLSQVMGSFFSALSLWLLYQYHELGRSEGDRGKYYLSIFFFILALLSKETSTGLLPAIFFLITTGQTTNADGLRKLRRIFLEMLPYNLGLLFYGFLRMNAGGNLPVFGSSDMYGFRIGSNLLKHLWLFMGEAVLPVSTVTVIRAQYVHTYVVVLVSFIFAGILFSIVAIGLWKSKRKRLIKGLFAMILFSWLPAIMLNHISEIYIYNSLFYFAMLVGISCDHYRDLFSERPPAIITASLWLILISAGTTNIIGIQEKASLMTNEGERASSLLPQIISITRNNQEDNWLYLVNPEHSEFTYSKYASRYFDVLFNADTIVRYYSGKPRSHYFIGDSSKCAESARLHPGIAIGFDQQTMRTYPITLSPDR